MGTAAGGAAHTEARIGERKQTEVAVDADKNGVGIAGAHNRLPKVRSTRAVMGRARQADSLRLTDDENPQTHQ